MALDSLAGSSPEDFTHTGRQVVLVADTNFFKKFAMRDLWAYHSVMMTQSIAKKDGKEWLWRAPNSVIRKYSSFYRNHVVDEDKKLPIAPYSLEKLLGSVNDVSLSISTRTVADAATAFPVYPGREDEEVLTLAIGIARQGADVYVASYDIKDVIEGVKRFREKNSGENLKITPLPPQPLKMGYFREFGHNFRRIVTDEVVAAVQPLKNKPFVFPVVLFERGVKSGDAVFDAGVDVAEKAYLQKLILPDRSKVIAGNNYRLPVLKLPRGLTEERKEKLMRGFTKETNSDILVMDEENPLKVRLVSALGSRSTLITAGLDFLRYQANSAFAMANYIPVRNRVSIPK